VEGEDLGLPGSHGADQPGQLRELDAILPAAEALSRRVIFSLVSDLPAGRPIRG
jgi:hypothetical protein